MGKRMYGPGDDIQLKRKFDEEKEKRAIAEKELKAAEKVYARAKAKCAKHTEAVVELHALLKYGFGRNDVSL